MHPSFDWKAAFAAEVMKQGGVVAYPTEAVWGLGCDPHNRRAVERLLSLKDRPVEKGLILISGDIAHFQPYLNGLEDDLQKRFKEKRNRATTWLVPDANHRIPFWVKGEHNTVAMRLTTHPLCVALTRHFGGAIVSTSANPSGFPSATSLSQVRHYFFDHVDYCLQAPLGRAGDVSQIIDLETGNVLRG